MPDKAKITVNVFNGKRRPIDPNLSVLITITDRNLKQHFRDDRKGSTFGFEVPFHNNLADDYTVLVADGKFSEDSPDQTALRAYRGRRIHLPANPALWPDRAHLAWHRGRKYQGA